MRGRVHSAGCPDNRIGISCSLPDCALRAVGWRWGGCAGSRSAQNHIHSSDTRASVHYHIFIDWWGRGAGRVSVTLECTRTRIHTHTHMHVHCRWAARWCSCTQSTVTLVARRFRCPGPERAGWHQQKVENLTTCACCWFMCVFVCKQSQAQTQAGAADVASRTKH